MERCILWIFCKNDGLCELQGDSGPLHWSAPTGSGYDTGCMNATCSVHCSDTRVIRHKKWDDLLTPRSLRFFNSPNIHTCNWMTPIHSIKSLWFCPLEVEFAIFCPELSPCTHSIIALDWEKPTAVHSAWWVDLQCEKQIVSKNVKSRKHGLQSENNKN